MKNTISTAFLASALLAQQAVATYNWGGSPAYGTPENCDNQCSDDQSKGWSWGGISSGSFSSFDDFDFSGFDMQDSFNGKRSLNTRTGSSKCAVGSASKPGNSNPSFGCSKRPFSVDTIDIEVEYDTDLEFLHTMPDGSTCKHVTSCSGRSTVKNTQCGGSQTVTIQKPHNGDDKPCSIGVHGIGFDCSPGKGKPPPSSQSYTTKSYTTKSEKPSKSKSTETPPTTYTTPPNTYTTSPTTYISPTASGNLSYTVSTPTTTPEQQSTSTDVVTTVLTITSCGPEVPSCPAGSSTVITTTMPPAPTQTLPTATTETTPASPATTTVITVVTTTVCPVTLTTTSGSSTYVQTTQSTSTVTVVTTSTVCNKCTEAPTTTLVPVPTPSPTTSPSGGEQGGCPQVVPQCLNTWLSYLPECKDNSDVSCFCPSQQFTEMIYSCLQAYGADDAEVQAAASYFAGICAAYVPQNPAIVTACPTTVTLTAYPGTVTASGSVTTVYVTAGTVTSQVTVPQVVFTTATVTAAQTGVSPSPTGSVGLIPGPAASPTSNPAATVSATYPTGSNGTVTSAPSPTITPFTGSAVAVDSRFGLVAAAVIAGLAVLA